MDETAHRQILDSVPDGVFTVDLDWRITSFNRSAERITGIPRAEALGQRCCEVFRANICESSCALRQSLANGRSVANKVVYIVHPSGQRIPISVSAAPLRDPNGRITGGVESFRDLRIAEELRRQAEQQDSFSDIIGRSRPMRQLFDILPAVAASDSTVLIEGASGTGKELVARAVHRLSRRSSRRFVGLNCAALPDTLLESELFGYKAGAFTGARKDNPGRFAAAQGGTLFLDEIGDISPAMQMRLLRVLQERVYEPLGSSEPVPCDVRIVSATNRPLVDLIRDGRFREDLYYRVNVVRLELPPLRDRKEDIPLLAEHFIARFNRLQGRDIAGLSDASLAALLHYDFPGNIRELENAIEHAFVLCRSGLIEPTQLPAPFQNVAFPTIGCLPPGLTLANMEQQLLRDALRRHDGNRAAAARELGINVSTLFRKLKTLASECPEKRNQRGSRSAPRSGR